MGFQLGFSSSMNFINLLQKCRKTEAFFFETSPSAVNNHMNLRNYITPISGRHPEGFGFFPKDSSLSPPFISRSFPPRSFEVYPTHWPFGWQNVHVRIPLLQWSAAYLPYAKCPQLKQSWHNLITTNSKKGLRVYPPSNWKWKNDLFVKQLCWRDTFSKSMIVVK